MHLTGRLVQGVDVWLNTPRRPWEACGTSGMKVLVNGGLNLSELDGWWAEAYAPEVAGHSVTVRNTAADPAWDAVEAEALYERLECEVIPEFYNRNEKGIPTAWVARMREKHGAIDPALLRQPRRDRIHGATLSTGSGCLRTRALPTKAPSAGRWSIGNTGWNRIGRRCTSAGEGWRTRDGKHIIEVQVASMASIQRRYGWSFMPTEWNGGPPVRQEMTCLHHCR